MRAVADAQILLERAVRILNDKPPMEKDTGERLAEGLQRHDLDAVVVAIDTKDCPDRVGAGPPHHGGRPDHIPLIGISNSSAVAFWVSSRDA